MEWYQDVKKVVASIKTNECQHTHHWTRERACEGTQQWEIYNGPYKGQTIKRQVIMAKRAQVLRDMPKYSRTAHVCDWWAGAGMVKKCRMEVL